MRSLKMIKMPLLVLRVAAFCFAPALLTSCGSENGGNSAPPARPGSTITVNPETIEWTVGGPGCTNTVMQDEYFNIVVRNPNGVPLTGVGLSVSLVLAPGTYIPPPQVMYLYDDLDQDGFFTDLITTYPHYVQTMGAGTKMLRVQHDLGGCEYGGNLDVFSGTAYGFGHISVTVPAAP